MRVKPIPTGTAAALVLSAILSSNAFSSSAPVYESKYVGQEKRDIKSLSAEDVRELTEGAGWGLAKAAELNGLPGPKHILEMKKEIDLTADQERKVTELYRQMRERAVELGRKLIAQERELNDRFAQRDIDEKILDDLLTKISDTHRSLRYTHLSAHLKTPDILTEGQIDRYNQLRGYASDDPCANVPEGHDPVMWRRHNNCD